MSRSIGQVLCGAQRRLRDAGIDDAKLEARILTAHVLGVERSALLALAHDAPPPGLTAKLDPLLKRRVAREPLAHITGLTEFYGLPIRTQPGALIPRNDSETLVDIALRHLPDDGPLKVADLGTGTGCLLIAILHHRKRATGDAIDASADAIQLARENAALNGVADRAVFQHASWRDWDGWSACDVVVSNPPYIATPVIASLQPEVRDHDPHLALDGGTDGLDAYRDLSTLMVAQGRPGARLILEIGYDQAETVPDILQSAGFSGIEIHNDLAGHPRVVSCHLK